MKKFASRTLAITTLSAIALSAQAKDMNSGFHFLLNGGFTGGGDKIATAQYTNGTTQSITAGGLVQFGGGVIWQAANMPLALEATVSYHVDNATATNGDMKFSRIPLEGIAYYTGVKHWRFGAGLRFVQSAKYTGEVTGGTNESLKFKNTVGGVVQVGYGITEHAWVNVRFVAEKYKPTTYTNNGTSIDVSNTASFNGSHAGVNFTYEF